MDLEIIILSKSDREIQIPHDITYVESKIWHRWTYLWNRNRLTDLENELVVTSGEGCSRRTDWEFGIGMYTLLHLKWITNRDLLYSTGNSAQYYVTTYMGKIIWNRIDICICITESLCCPLGTNTTLLISCTPVWNKKFF